MKKLRCKVCKNKFKPKRQRRYVVKEVVSVLMLAPATFHRECHDCPFCGCQNVLNNRLVEATAPKTAKEALPIG